MSDLLKQLSGAGMEMLEKSESMPFIKLLAFQSPEVIDPEKQIEGAKAGDLVFAPTQEILPQPVEFAVVAMTTVYAEWKPLKDGGGLLNHHPLTIISHPDYSMGSPTSKWDEFLGTNELEKTMYVFIKFNKDGEWTDGLLAFKKSGLSAAGRPLQKMIKQFRYGPDVTHDLQPSILSQTYHLTSAVSSNSENQWWNWKVAPGRVLDIEDDKALLEDCLTSMKEAALMLPAPQEVQLLETTEAVF